MCDFLEGKQSLSYSNTGTLPDSWTVPGMQWVLILAVEMNEQIPTAKHNDKTHGRCTGNVRCDLTASPCPVPTTEQVLSVKHLMNKLMVSHGIVLSTW